MQEKHKPVFIIATANNIRELPAEMLRKGRFGEIFFVDLPTQDERVQILQVHLEKRKRDPKQFDINRLADESEGFTGAELEEVTIAALHDSFADGRRPLTTDDISRCILQTVPLSITMKEQIQELRRWAAARARPASRVPEPVPIPTYEGRRLEV